MSPLVKCGGRAKNHTLLGVVVTAGLGWFTKNREAWQRCHSPENEVGGDPGREASKCQSQ